MPCWMHGLPRSRGKHQRDAHTFVRLEPIRDLQLVAQLHLPLVSLLRRLHAWVTAHALGMIAACRQAALVRISRPPCCVLQPSRRSGQHRPGSGAIQDRCMPPAAALPA